MYEIVVCFDQKLPFITFTQLKNRRGTYPIVEELFGTQKCCGYHIALSMKKKLRNGRGGGSKGVI